MKGPCDYLEMILELDWIVNSSQMLWLRQSYQKWYFSDLFSVVAKVILFMVLRPTDAGKR